MKRCFFFSLWASPERSQAYMYATFEATGTETDYLQDY